MKIQLTKHELDICKWVGTCRYEYAIKTSRNPGHGPSAQRKGPQNDIRGAKAEFAASVACNLYWRPTVGEIDKPDVGGYVEVRSTDRPDGRLIIKPTDSNSAPWILVYVNDAECDVIGWIYGFEGKRDFPLLTDFGDPAHFVTQPFLAALDLLPRPKSTTNFKSANPGAHTPTPEAAD